MTATDHPNGRALLASEQSSSIHGVESHLGGVLCLVIPVASAFLLRASIGYRPFPSIDELAYAPVFRSVYEPVAYTRDVIVAGTPPHALLWSLLFRFGEQVGQLPLTMYVATFVLSVATTVGAFRLMRVLGARGALFPIAAILAFAGILKGIGRGTYDGVFGDGVHGQWMALVCLLFAYDALARGRHVLSGALLGALSSGTSVPLSTALSQSSWGCSSDWTISGRA